MKRIINKNMQIRSATQKDLPTLVKLSLLYENEDLVLSNKGNFWQKHLNTKSMTQLIKKWLKNKNNYFLIVEDATGKGIGFLHAVLVNMDPIMKVKTICSIKELVVFKDKNAKKVLINLIDTITKKIYKKTKYFTIHVNPNNKKNIKNYLKIGFKPSYLFLGKRVKSIKVLNKQDIKIRLATHKDFDELVKLNQLFELEESKIAGKDDFWRSYLDKELVENDIKNLLKNKNNYYFVAENSQGKIVGFLNALLEETSPITKIKRVCGMKILYVLPKYRGKQISSKLMTAMEKNIIKKTKHFVISVSPNNKKAIIIYSKKGFNSLYLCLGKKHK